MKVRVLVAVCLLPILLVIVLALPLWVTAVLVAAMAALAVHELLHTAGLCRNTRMIVYSMVAAVAVVLWSYGGCPRVWGVSIVWLYMIALFCELLAADTKMPFSVICMTAFSGLVVPFMLAALVRILQMEHGRFYILVAFILAFTSDSGAYFVGRRFGRHKLAPTISPKKTIEGVVGGVLSCVAFMLLYCLVLQLFFHFKVDYLSAVLYGVFGSLGSVVGDLTFSVVKRQSGIKDYGKLLPGHGGILDRFDSTIVVAPMAEILLMSLPLIVK